MTYLRVNVITLYIGKRCLTLLRTTGTCMLHPKKGLDILNSIMYVNMQKHNLYTPYMDIRVSCLVKTTANAVVCTCVHARIVSFLKIYG